MKTIWESTEIVDNEGKRIQAIAPVIISASRSTDIPAFFSEWFLDRLQKGYVKWINPFNQAPVYVSFKNTRVIIFWTKNPFPLMKRLHEIDAKGINYYFQFTLNDYEKEGLEPHLPPLKDRINTFVELSRRLGRERVVWRFDPLILVPPITVQGLLQKIKRLSEGLIENTDKLVVSFVDIRDYQKVQRNLIKELPDVFNKSNVLNTEFTDDQKIEFGQGIQNLINQWRKVNPAFTVGSCAETVDLERFGILHNKCIDDDLLIKVFVKDRTLMDFIGYTSEGNLGLFGKEKRNLKDKGQRKACGCIISKDIGMYNTCGHLCVYCYANASKKLAIENARKFYVQV